MNLDNPAILMSGLVIGTIGLGLFLYGRKAGSARALLAGVVLGVLPLGVQSLAVLWGATAACLAGLYVFRER